MWKREVSRPVEQNQPVEVKPLDQPEVSVATKTSPKYRSESPSSDESAELIGSTKKIGRRFSINEVGEGLNPPRRRRTRLSSVEKFLLKCINDFGEVKHREIKDEEFKSPLKSMQMYEEFNYDD